MTPSAMRTWRLGVDVGGSSVRVVAQDEDGTRSAVRTEPVPRAYDDFLALVADLTRDVVPGPLAAVGCGLPGTAHGQTAAFVPALPWIEGRPVGADLAAALGAPVSLALDGHLTLLAEAREGAARGRRSAVLVAVGTGIGGALMVDGRIWRGRDGSAGSWGWLPAAGAVADVDHGGFEQVASGSALTALAAAAEPPTTAQALVGAARAGDEAACGVVREYAQRLGRGIAALASLLDPEIVLVGGGLSAAMDVLQPHVDDAVRQHASPDGRSVPVRATALGPHAGVVGALHVALDEEQVWL
jgi:predicted NBD/HSP70 family sugar kinase